MELLRSAPKPLLWLKTSKLLHASAVGDSFLKDNVFFSSPSTLLIMTSPETFAQTQLELARLPFGAGRLAQGHQALVADHVGLTVADPQAFLGLEIV